MYDWFDSLSIIKILSSDKLKTPNLNDLIKNFFVEEPDTLKLILKLGPYYIRLPCLKFDHVTLPFLQRRPLRRVEKIVINIHLM